MKNVVISVVIVVVIVPAVGFVPLLEVPYTVQHQHAEIFYEDGWPKERPVIRFETYHEKTPIVEYLRSRFQG